MNLFLSKFKNKIDVKGRVSIPVSFRNILLKDISQRMFCYPSLDAQAIDAGGQSLSKEIYALMDNLDPYSDERDYLSTALFGLSEELKIDNDGRVILSDALIDHAQIKDEVTFVGLGEKFQIWEPLKFESYLQQAQKKVKEQRLLLSKKNRGI
ncbi:MAG: division/cell wall cluster transcriptional repressor MraZ [Rhodobiaceae bacterium]|nr:division/cell wall cluster transcriptional repressor MraZ [Rhodobiaceae bacterium]|tara:strand:- start:77374 stop:77832 length:459 start_codon:yes stop_codon:yes gene_type:complete